MPMTVLPLFFSYDLGHGVALEFWDAITTLTSLCVSILLATDTWIYLVDARTPP